MQHEMHRKGAGWECNMETKETKEGKGPVAATTERLKVDVIE